MFVAAIVIPSFLLTLIMGGLVWYDYIPDAWKWTLVFPLAILVGTFVIRRGLQEWWHTKKPPKLADVEKDILERFFPYYRQLNAEYKREFEGRVALFRLQKVFQMRGAPKIPGDIQLLVSASAVQVSFGFPRGKELFLRLATIVLYPKTFITPEINEEMHAVELHEDKKTNFDCLLLSINMFVGGLQAPNTYYNTGVYGFALALKSELGIKDEDIVHEDEFMVFLTKLHVLRDFPVAYIFMYTGLEKFDVFELCVEFFFSMPQVLFDELPATYNYLTRVLNQDPLNAGSPVVEPVVEEL